jgi:hypothetical protein
MLKQSNRGARALGAGMKFSPSFDTYNVGFSYLAA